MQYLTERPSRVTGGLLDAPRSVDELFNRFWGGLNPLARVTPTWRPAVDVVETSDAYVLHAEIPGINPDDVEVTVTGDTLTIRGEKMVHEKRDDEVWCINERLPGRFERSFTLPTAIAAEDIEAEARHGILALKVMKAKEAQPHKISIRTT